MYSYLMFSLKTKNNLYLILILDFDYFEYAFYNFCMIEKKDNLIKKIFK